MEIDGLTFPQYKEHYLNLALTISSVCGLAIDNARAYEQIDEAKRLMEKSEREYRTLVETMTEGLGVVDEKGIITYTNSRLCKMLGYSRDKIIGTPATSFLDEENRKIVEKQAVKRRKGKESQRHMRLPIRTKAGYKCTLSHRLSLCLMVMEILQAHLQ